MHRSFSYTLLITWLLIFISCKTNYVATNYKTLNITLSEEVSALDSQVVQLYLPYKEILEKDMLRVISTSEIEMVKNKPESLLTNLLADILIEKGALEANSLGLENYPLISYFNYGGIRTSLPGGDITVGTIFELMPFENEMVFVLLKGKQIQEFFNSVAEKGGDSVGGSRFIISEKKAKNVLVGNEKLMPDNNYWVVTNDYVANGGDGLEIFLQNQKLINSGFKIRDVIIDYMETKQKEGIVIAAKLDGRISYE